jgi:hypothetical protein
MDARPRTREAAVLIPLLGVFLILPPILGLFDGPHSVAGIPLLHLYLCAVWFGLVVASFWLSRRLAREAAEPEPPRDPGPPPPAGGTA